MKDGDVVLGGALVQAAEDVGSPGSLALLRAVEATWPEPLSSQARSGGDRLARFGVPSPSWADTLGLIALEGVSMVEDPHGDVALLVATFSYRGERRHCAAALVDHNAGGMLSNAMVVDEAGLAAFFEHVAPQAADLTFDPVDPARAAAILATGLDIQRASDADPAWDHHSDVDRQGGLSFIDARLRTFPRPAHIARARPPSPRTCDRIVADFLGSETGDDLGGHVDHVEFVVRQMLDFKLRYGDGDPLRWSPYIVSEFMREWFPRKVTAGAESIDCLPEVVRRWARWSGRGRGIASDLVEETVAAVGDSERAFFQACRDRSRFMPAKAVATAMREDGVDVRDAAAVDVWLQALRRSSPRKRRAKLGQELDLAGVYVENGRIVVAVERPETLKDRHLLGV
jgi:hypothetical protein